MKIICVEPGPAHSTYDVWRGLVAGLRTNGHEVGTFALHSRLRQATRCLDLRWEDTGRAPEHEPTPGTVLFHASAEIVTFALLHKPDWVLFVASGLVHALVYGLLRQAGIRTAIVLTESPYEDERQAPLADVIDVLFTNERAGADAYGWHYLPHAYDPAIHRPLTASGPEARVGGNKTPRKAGNKTRPSQGTSASAQGLANVPAHDVVFVGTLWQERIDLFAAVDWSGIDLGLYGTAELFAHPANAANAARLAPYWHEGYVDNARTAALYRAAKIGLNPHRLSTHLAVDAPRIAGAESLNPRCYEQAATGGALLLTDRRAEGTEIFGDAAPTFETPDQLGELVRRYLADESARQERVRALRERIAPHTYAARAAQIAATLETFEPPATSAKGSTSWLSADSTARNPASSSRSGAAARLRSSPASASSTSRRASTG